MPRGKVRDYRSMSVEELRATGREGHAQERIAPYAKGRRMWKRAWQEAEAELQRRGLDT